MRQANCDGRGRKIDPRPTKSADRRTSAVSAPRRGDGRRPESILSGAPEKQKPPDGECTKRETGSIGNGIHGLMLLSASQDILFA